VIVHEFDIERISAQLKADTPASNLVLVTPDSPCTKDVGEMLADDREGTPVRSSA
jgi:hypothetical protein